jgi:hypothetical protein
VYAEDQLYTQALAAYNAALDSVDPDSQAASAASPGLLYKKALIYLTVIEDGPGGLELLTQALDAGFTDREALTQLLHHPDLTNPAPVRALFTEKGLDLEDL